MNDKIITRESKSLGHEWVAKEWTYDEIFEIWEKDDDTALVPVLANRCIVLERRLAEAEDRLESHAVLLNEFAGHVQKAKRERDEARRCARHFHKDAVSHGMLGSDAAWETACPWLTDEAAKGGRDAH